MWRSLLVAELGRNEQLFLGDDATGFTVDDAHTFFVAEQFQIGAYWHVPDSDERWFDSAQVVEVGNLPVRRVVQVVRRIDIAEDLPPVISRCVGFSTHHPPHFPLTGKDIFRNCARTSIGDEFDVLAHGVLQTVRRVQKSADMGSKTKRPTTDISNSVVGLSSELLTLLSSLEPAPKQDDAHGSNNRGDQNSSDRSEEERNSQWHGERPGEVADVYRLVVLHDKHQ